MASLYELSAEYAHLLDAYSSAQSEEEAAEILQSLENIEGNMTDKAEAYVKIIKNVQSDVDGYKAEAGRLADKARVGENLIERLKRAMLDAMTLTGTQEIKTSIGRWRVQMNPWSCEVVDIDKVPIQYHIKQEDKINKNGLLAKFKADGELIEGVTFTQEQGIRFR